MEVAIFFLLNVAGGVTGHYLKKGLESIDKKLAELFVRGAEQKEIEEYINNHQLGSQVEEYASTIAQDSVVIPMLPSGTPSLELRTEFFSSVLETCFRLSHSWKIDLLLPGSILGPDTFSLFSNNEASVPQLVREGPQLKLLGRETHKNSLKILPALDVSDVNSYWEAYKDAVLKHKSESDNYMNFEGRCNYCDVFVVTARSVKYEKQTLMSSKEIKMLPFESKSTLDGSALIGAWKEGIDRMLDGAFQIQELFVLPEEDLKQIEELTDRMRAFAGMT